MTRHFHHLPGAALGGREAATIALIALCAVGCAAAGEPFQVQLRLLDHNVFGFDQHSCEQRAAAFGHIVANAQPAYDIVGLNEYYNIGPDFGITCDHDPLLNAIRCTGRYTQSGNTMLFHPDDGSPNGGLGLFTLGTICDSREHKWAWQDFPDPLQGIMLARVAVPGTTVTLDVYVLHTHASSDGCDRCCHYQQLVEAADFIATHSRRSGNPVIVMGDFNIGGPPACCGNEGYLDIVSILGAPRDLWWEDHPCGSPDCGDPLWPCDGGAEGYCDPAACAGAPSPPMNSCIGLPSQCGNVVCGNAPAPQCDGWAGYTRFECLNSIDPPPFGERIDYIFVVEHPSFSSSAFRVDLVDQSARVVNWKVQLSPDNFLNVSDHLGVEATISIFGMSSIWVDAFQQSTGGGTSCNPFLRLSDAVTAVPVGDRILLRQGLYLENLTISKPCRLESVGGMAIIGL